MSGYLLVLLIFLAYAAIIFLAFRFKKEKLEARGITLWGPFIMVRTEKGKRVIQRLARYERFWRLFGNFSIVLVVCFMIGMFLLLVWEATIITQIPKEHAPSPQMLVGVPGINPLIPVWYGIWGLAIGIIIHEFCHGILIMVGKMKVKSLGLLFLILPMGAFAEPDEEQLKNAERKKRMRVYAVGPGINIIFALACAAVFSFAFMGAITPASEGAPITFVKEDTPAWDAGLRDGDFILSINGTPLEHAGYLKPVMNTTHAGDTVEVELFHKEEGRRNVTVTLGYWASFDEIYWNRSWYANETPSLGITVAETGGGVEVEEVLAGSPGHMVELLPGDVLLHLDNATFSTAEEYNATLYSLVPGRTICIGIIRNGTALDGNITVGAGKGFLDIQVTKYDLEKLAAYLHRPGKDTNSLDDLFVNSINYVALPFQKIGPQGKLSPMSGLITDFYVVEGPLAILPEGAFWVIANMLYWAFWISLMVGLTNALPAVPMDGGYLFHDLVSAFASKFSKDEERIEKVVDKVALALALSVLFLILWQLIGPRL